MRSTQTSGRFHPLSPKNIWRSPTTRRKLTLALLRSLARDRWRLRMRVARVWCRTGRVRAKRGGPAHITASGTISVPRGVLVSHRYGQHRVGILLRDAAVERWSLHPRRHANVAYASIHDGAILRRRTDLSDTARSLDRRATKSKPFRLHERHGKRFPYSGDLQPLRGETILSVTATAECWCSGAWGGRRANRAPSCRHESPTLFRRGRCTESGQHLREGGGLGKTNPGLGRPT